MKIEVFRRIALVLVLVAACTLPAQAVTRKSPPKNKPLAILLSLVSPGMGQMYEGDIGTGLALWTASSALSFAFFLTIGDIDLKSAWSPTIRYQLKPALTTSQLYWAGGFAVCYGILYAYNLIDAATFDPDSSPVSLNFGTNSVSVNYSVQW
jgi:TM2 domain-containing membrane protein YozV